MPNVVRIPVAAGAFDPADITLTDDTSGALLIKEGSNEYMRINTTNGSELTTIKAGSTQGISINGNSRINVLTGTTDSNSDFRIINSGGVQIFRVQGNHDTRFRAQNFYITDKATDTPYLQTDTNTNFTYTLDDASGAVFKVVDDGASPYTYLSATEGENAVRMSALRTDSSGLLQFQNNTGALFFDFSQNSYFHRHVKPKDSKLRTNLTGSGASQSHTIDLRLGSVKGVQHLVINHGYSGTQTVTLNFNNTLSSFAGNQDWGVNSLLVLVENKTTGQDVTFQIRETTGGTTTFIDHTGASLSNPTGSGSLTLKNVGAASGKNFITFRVSQFNNNHGSASLYDDDRYIVEALTAELY